MKLARSLVAIVFSLSLLLISPGLSYSAAKEEKPPTKAQEKQAPAKKELIDINTASEDELKSLAGIGDATAKKIIANRPYKRKDDLVKQKIISQKTYDKIQDQIIARQAKTK